MITVNILTLILVFLVVIVIMAMMLKRIIDLEFERVNLEKLISNKKRENYLLNKVIEQQKILLTVLDYKIKYKLS